MPDRSAEAASAKPGDGPSWSTAELLAVDLEGSGPQDPDGEAILEIALVPLRHGAPDTGSAYTTLINPGRPIRRGPWTSPGLTNTVLADAPPLAAVGDAIQDRIEGRILVGHNISVDWRLIHLHLPNARPIALLDTLRLARHRRPDLKKGHSLTAWIERLNLADAITSAAAGSQPHRALWDAVAAAELLRALMHDAPPDEADPDNLLQIAGVPLNPVDRRPLDLRAERRTAAGPPMDQQPALWDLP